MVEIFMFWLLCGIVGLFAIVTYALPCLIQLALPLQDLKKRYNANWALVTGGSSGIGESLVHRLASQGINVVVVALQNKLMDESMKRFKATYPSIQFRGVGCDLSQPGFIEAVKGSTSDIHISLVFNNAGYIMPGFFVDHGIDSLMANYNVNATCNLPLTHHFAQRMVQSGRKGLICFTSSSGGFIPGPMSSIYSSTKAFVTNFAVSIAAELAEDGIDVLCVHPSPIASNFYQNAGQMSALKSVQKAAQPPSVIADIVFKNAGRFTIVDQGLVSVLFKSILKIVDWNLLGEIMVKMVRTNGDYKAFRKARKNK